MRILPLTNAAEEKVLASRRASGRDAERIASRIVADVRRRGDAALFSWTKRFDRVALTSRNVWVSRAELAKARKSISKDFLAAIDHAARNIRAVARRQKPQEWTIEVEPGVRAGQRVRAIDSVGCYLPGGRFSLVSTLLMTVIPAQEAGVRQIIVASPQPGPALLAAAERLGVERVARIGGAQAIAALAYGTRSIPRVDKIFGPGNRFVTAAKKLVSSDCAIDLLAGPTEAIVFATRGNPQFIAADLIAQAEHDPDAISILVTTSTPLAKRVAAEIDRQLSALPKTNLARSSLAKNGAVLVARDLASAARFVNRFAPGAPESARWRRWPAATHRFRRQRFPRRLERAVLRRLRERHEPRPADGRRGADARRAFRLGFYEVHQRAGSIAQRCRAPRAGGGRVRPRGRPGRARARRRGAPVKPSAKTPVPVRRAVGRMRPYNPPLEGRTEKLRLDFNENPTGCSPAVRRALAKLTAASISAYPEQETVRRKAARHFGVRPDELLLTNGTDEALSLVVNTFVESGDTVLLAEPTYAMYRFYAELAGARILAPRYDSAMKFPWKEILAALRSAPRVFFLPNPNSPTGNLLSRRDLRRILNAATRTMVVIDEAYFEFSGVTVIPWICRHRNLIVTRTFSKTAGLAGLRLGCIFVHRELATTMRKAQSPYPVNAAALAAAEAAMRDRKFPRADRAESPLGPPRT